MNQRRLLSEGDGYCANANQPHDFEPIGEPSEYAAVAWHSLYCRRCAEVIEVVVSDDRVEGLKQ